MACRTTSTPRIAWVTGAIALLLAMAVPAHALSATTEATTSRKLVNGARADAGLVPLPADARLERIAREHSARMAERRTIWHSEHLGQDASAAGVDWGWLGENVGVGADAELIHDGFMNSPHHREIVESRDANAIGVGVAIGEDGRVYLTQVYAKLRSAGTASTAPARPEPRTVHAASANLIGEHTAAPALRRPSVDPNVVIGGVVRHDTFRPGGRSGFTRSGLRAS